MKRPILKALERAGYVVFNTRSPHGYAQDGLFTMNNDHFRSAQAFRSAYARGVEASEGFDPKMEWRVHVALWAASTAARVPGDFVECGVWKGFSSAVLCKYLDFASLSRTFHSVRCSG